MTGCVDDEKITSHYRLLSTSHQEAVTRDRLAPMVESPPLNENKLFRLKCINLSQNVACFDMLIMMQYEFGVFYVYLYMLHAAKNAMRVDTEQHAILRCTLLLEYKTVITACCIYK
jgi:hypothetical protein